MQTAHANPYDQAMLSEPSKHIVVPASNVSIYLTAIYSFQFTTIALALNSQTR